MHSQVLVYFHFPLISILLIFPSKICLKSSSITLRMWRTRKPGGNLCSSIYVLFLFMSAKLSIAVDTLTRGQSLQGIQTLTSKDGNFELGFLNYSKNSYLAIWYKDFSEKTAVWMANREAPVLEDSPGFKLEFSSDGNLGLFDGSHNIWSTTLTSIVPDSIEAVLLDTGNFILRESLNPSTILWQSFDHPTDTWLPGATLGVQTINGKTQRLVSWRNTDDPSPGLYSVEVSQDRYPEFVMTWNMSVRYWRSGGWNGIVFGSAPELSYLTNFSFVSNENETYFTYSLLNSAVFSRLVISPSGKLEQLTTLRGHSDWSAVTVQPKNQADVFGFCGAFGVYTSNPSNPCRCLQGFEPVQTRFSEGFGGRSRKSALQCGNSNSSTGNEDGFLRNSDMGLPAYPKTHPAQNARGCASTCLQNCSCVAYAFNESGCLIWDGSLIDLRFSDNDSNVLYLKLVSSELQDAKGKKKILEVIVAVVVPIVISGGLLGCFFTRRNKRKGNKDIGEDLLSFDFNYTDNPTNGGTNMRKGNVKDLDLPMFSYASVSAATNNFSMDNKVGEGGYGPVYKGKLSNGQEVALKRLSKRSGQGFEEFRNEILLIAKLQHRNLVRLLGCCIDQDESILIYEYMTNKSLDFFLFDPNKQENRDWELRVRIIEGIAQGILYLHEYSRLRIIHRDLKASNILLDGDLNPKISDFGMARIFGGNDSRTNTQRIVGTYGYMAPEYAMQGLFSIKSDVFSFGVLVLEIISGKKNTGFYDTESLNLLGHAWELWISDRGVELKDSAVGSPPVAAVLRHINVGLLCVQENPNDRPNMSTVISMLGNEIAPLPAPNKPAFSISRGVKPNSTSSGNNAGNYSLNGLTVSMIEPR